MRTLGIFLLGAFLGYTLSLLSHLNFPIQCKEVIVSPTFTSPIPPKQSASSSRSNPLSKANNSTPDTTIQLAPKPGSGSILFNAPQVDKIVSNVKTVATSKQEPQPICNLCDDYDWVFIVSTGRAGSTTILNMLYSLPDVQMAGELKLLATLDALPGFGNNEKIPECFRIRNHHMYDDTIMKPTLDGVYKNGWVNVKTIKCHLQQYVREVIGYESKPYFPSVESQKKKAIVGYKMLFWEPFQKYDSWKKLFPCARVILNYRNDLAGQVKSGFYSGSKVEDARKRTENMKRVFGNSEMQDRIFDLPLESFSLAKFNELLKWLGFSGCSYRRVAHANNNGTYKDGNNSNLVNGTCTYGLST